MIDVIQSKYPKVRVPGAGDFDTYPHDEEQLPSFPVYYIEDEVVTGAAGLPSGAGSSEVDEDHLKNWILQYKVSSDCLCQCQEMIEGVEFLSNTSPDYVAYRAVNSG